jgi:cell division protein FtsN
MVDSGVAHVSLQILDFVSPVDLFAVQVGAYGTERNAERAAAMLTGDGFVVTTEKSSLGMTRVLVRALSSQELEETRKKLVKLGFSNYLVRREKTEPPREAQVTRP